MQPKKKHIVQEGQNIFDVAIELFGSISGIRNLIRNNPGLNIEPLYPGQELLYLPEVLNKEVVNDYASRGYFSTTADTMTDAPVPPPAPDPNVVIIEMYGVDDVSIEAPGVYTVPPSTVEDGDGNTIATLSPGEIYIDAACPTFDPVTIKDSDENILYSLGSGAVQELPDAVAKNSAGTVIGTNLATQEIIVEDITVTQADGSETEEPAGAPVLCSMPELHLINSEDTEIETISVYPSLGVINAPDATVTLQDTTGATVLIDTSPSGGNKDIEVPDATWVLRNTTPTIVDAGAVVCGGNADIIAPDAEVRLKDTAGATLSVENAKSGIATDIIAPDAIVNRDGVFYSNVKSGGTINVPSDGITPSGILYKRPFCSQKTSFRTGDTGWHCVNGTFNFTRPANPSVFQDLDYSATNWFFTLLHNNAFGNKFRFTNSVGSEALDGMLNFSGAKTYTTGGGINFYVVDHLTGLGFYVANLGNITTGWSDAIDVAHAQRAGNLLGFNDWFPLTVDVLELSMFRDVGNTSIQSIMKRGIVSGHNESFAWTGETHMTSTGLARYYRQGNEIAIITKGSASVTTIYVCRAHY